MKIERTFTTAGEDAYAGIEFTTTTSEIRNPDGTIAESPDDLFFCETQMGRDPEEG